MGEYMEDDTMVSDLRNEVGLFIPSGHRNDLVVFFKNGRLYGKGGGILPEHHSSVFYEG